MDYLQRLTPVIRYLERHYAEPVNLQQVAEIANLSPYYFHRIFKSVTGETLAEKSQYGQFWQDLMNQVVASGFECDDRPCFELYHRYDPETNVADVSFYTAIKG